MNLGFYISGKSNRLFKFLKQADSTVIRMIKVVISDYAIDNALQTLLEKAGIQCAVYEYKQLTGNGNKEKNRTLSDCMKHELDAYAIDYCFSFGSHLLSGELLEAYKYRLINFHPAILPMYPGVNAIDQAVAHGNTFLVGNTAHFIDSGMDTGIIIMQSVMPLQAFLYEKDYDVILDMQIEMLNLLIDILTENRLHVRDGRAIIDGAMYTKGVIFPAINRDKRRGG